MDELIYPRLTRNALPNRGTSREKAYDRKKESLLTAFAGNFKFPQVARGIFIQARY